MTRASPRSRSLYARARWHAPGCRLLCRLSAYVAAVCVLKITDAFRDVCRLSYLTQSRVQSAVRRISGIGLLVKARYGARSVRALEPDNLVTLSSLVRTRAVFTRVESWIVHVSLSFQALLRCICYRLVSLKPWLISSLMIISSYNTLLGF